MRRDRRGRQALYKRRALGLEDRSPLARPASKRAATAPVPAAAARAPGARKGSDAKARLAVDAHGVPLGFPVAGGAGAGRRPAAAPTGGFGADFSPADGAYDTDGAPAEEAEIGDGTGVPQKSNREARRDVGSRLCRPGTWPGTPSGGSRGGAGRPPATARGPPPSSPPRRSAAFRFGSVSCDDAS